MIIINQFILKKNFSDKKDKIENKKSLGYSNEVENTKQRLERRKIIRLKCC